MGCTEEQKEELKELVYKALSKLTSKSLDAYTTSSSVSLLMGELIGSSSLGYQTARVPRILDELYREDKVKRVQIMVRQIYPHHTRRKFYAYRVSS